MCPEPTTVLVFSPVQVMNKYWGKNPGTLPPHPYAISDVAYRQMLRDRKNQAGAIFVAK